MNGIDLALFVCIVLAGVRGLSRGFFRETFATVALVSATAAAFYLNDSATDHLEKYLASTTPQAAQGGVAFVGMFSVLYVIVSSIGFLFERYVSSPLGRALSAAGGAVVGSLKGTMFAAFFVLFVYLFVPTWSARLMKSQVAETLVRLAGNTLRFADPYAAPATDDYFGQAMK